MSAIRIFRYISNTTSLITEQFSFLVKRRLRADSRKVSYASRVPKRCARFETKIRCPAYYILQLASCYGEVKWACSRLQQRIRSLCHQLSGASYHYGVVYTSITRKRFCGMIYSWRANWSRITYSRSPFIMSSLLYRREWHNITDRFPVLAGTRFFNYIIAILIGMLGPLR